MSENLTREELQFDNAAKVSTKGSAILGRLHGPCADIINPTRNGRKYSKELWKKVFANPIVKEYFECGGVFGELGHPADRSETDMEKIAICMPEPPVETPDGELVGYWDILDTPNGRILKTLCDYGYKIGISSRGSGDTYLDFDGQESVDPESYEFNAFDAVLLPAVKAARLNLVTESLDSSMTLKQALCESLDSATAAERKIMTETLDSLHIDYSPETVNNTIASNKAPDNEEVDSTESALVKELQEALKSKSVLESKINELQEKLSVCYAKEEKQEDKLARYRIAVKNLTETAKRYEGLKAKHEALKEQLNESARMAQSTTAKIKSLTEEVNSEKETAASVTESLRAQRVENMKLKQQVNDLAESLKAEKVTSSQKVHALEEQLSTINKDLSIKSSEYATKIDRANKLVEKYKKIANSAVEKYIQSQATRIGVSSNEIKSKLSESYTFSEIDEACEELQAYKLNMSKLPFNASLKESVKMKVSPSKETIVNSRDMDDLIDDQLLQLI